MPRFALRLSCVILIAASLGACAFRDSGAPRLMLEGDVVAPPNGWNAFCDSAPGHCAPPVQETAGLPSGPEALAALAEINQAVNDAIAPMTDLAQFGVLDRWTLPLTTDDTTIGDCEDYALEKRRMLIEAGWPPEALRLAVATSKETGVHAALIALTTEGDYVLDNLVDEVRLWTMTDYIWLKRQASADPTEWRRVVYR
jgi:predicted transglutaminase-like cysteine proteinase